MDRMKYLLHAVEVSKHAVIDGNHPFGSILVADKGNVLLEQGNLEVTTSDCTGHAETVLMRRSSQQYDREFLATCTLYTTAEPCGMCAGAIYWGNVLSPGVRHHGETAPGGNRRRSQKSNIEPRLSDGVQRRTKEDRGNRPNPGSGRRGPGVAPDLLDAKELTLTAGTHGARPVMVYSSSVSAAMTRGSPGSRSRCRKPRP
ncbi:nucleoside deaminase [Rhodococcus jostii]|uniref:nucleoside deaminase n=1 Tax=Rhodococcus jostii TaxID=132919 RepID=UPI00363C3163